MTKHLLTKQQRAAGLDTYEDDHYVYIVNTVTSDTVAIFCPGCLTIHALQRAADDYLKEKGS